MPYRFNIRSYFLRKIFKLDGFSKIWKNNDFDGPVDSIKKWLPMDTLSRYNENGNKEYGIDDIVYEINKNGYRVSSKMPKSKNIVACFGCSNTMGIGLPWDETWPSRLNFYLGDDYCVKNYGISGASNDTIARIIHNYTLKNKPKVICCFFPDIFRMEVFSDGFFQNYTPLYSDHYNEKDHDAYLKIATLEYSFSNFIKNFKFIEMICKINNIKFYWFTWSSYILNLNKINIDDFLNYENFLTNIVKNPEEFDDLPRARDNAHFGKIINDRIGKGFSKKISKVKF